MPVEPRFSQLISLKQPEENFSKPAISEVAMSEEYTPPTRHFVEIGDAHIPAEQMTLSINRSTGQKLSSSEVTTGE